MRDELTETIGFDDLVERCKKGDTKAYTDLYHRHAKELYNTIYRFVNHTGEAEDLLQDTFLAAYQHINQFQYKSSFNAWLKRIAINKAISFIRKRKIKFSETEIETVSIADEVFDEAGFTLKVDEVKKAITQLSDGYRTIVNLYLFENIPQEEIGEMLGISHTTVRTQYHRAKAKIYESLQKGGLV